MDRLAGELEALSHRSTPPGSRSARGGGWLTAPAGPRRREVETALDLVARPEELAKAKDEFARG